MSDSMCESTYRTPSTSDRPESADRCASVTAEDYARAESRLPIRADMCVYRVEPAVRNGFEVICRKWINGGPAFWYRVRVPQGFEFMYADPARKERRPAFDHARLATALSMVTGTNYAASRLPFESIELTNGASIVRFAVGMQGWCCDLRTYLCVHDPAAAPTCADEARSPDGHWTVIAREHNLWVRELSTGAEKQLTHCGAERNGWGTLSGTAHYVAITRSSLLGAPVPWSPDSNRFLTRPRILWSPDSKRFLTYRLDERQVGQMHLVQSVNPDGPRPRLWSYAFPLPGDQIIPLARFSVFVPANGRRVDVASQPIQVLLYDPISLQQAWWSEDGKTIYFIDWERGRCAYRLKKADAATGETRMVLEERADTRVQPSPGILSRPNIRLLAEGREVIWFSERDGWAHLYRFSVDTGRLINRVTSGAFAVSDILHIDEKSRRIVFIGRGREPERDPYYRHAYSVRLDGSELKLLTPEDADHEVSVSPDGTFLVDTYSTVDKAPTIVIRRTDGEWVQLLEEADVYVLRSAGWRPPERVCVKAADGATDIYGTIYLPTHLDPSECYPVLDDIYPGPQINWGQVAFRAGSHQQALAELGFIVLTLDGRGTPLRSKSFHDYSYGNLQSAGGLEDHIAALKQLAQERPYLDLARVGIYGHSAGGYASARALLLYPNFYRVAVSSAGNHDQRTNFAFWGESYQGLPVGDNYAAAANASLVANLEGKLLLVYSELDENSHSAMTIQFVDALVKANKDFDLLVLPGIDHGFRDNPYFVRRRWDYFVQHLLGHVPPKYKIQGSESGQ
jgi:dipeptidyl-peptidase 4